MGANNTSVHHMRDRTTSRAYCQVFTLFPPYLPGLAVSGTFMHQVRAVQRSTAEEQRPYL